MKTTFDEELLVALKWEDNTSNVAHFEGQFSRMAIVHGRESDSFTIIREVKSFKEPEVLYLSKEDMQKIVNFYNTL
jgi:hypothetical protein